MIETKALFADKNKKWPDWIKNHSVFKKHPNFDKVFPHIGLTNCEESIKIDNVKEATNAAKYLLVDLQKLMNERQTKLAGFVKKKETPSADRKKMNANRKRKYENCSLLLETLRTDLNKKTAKVITTVNGKITLNIPNDVKDINGNVIFKAGEGLFRVYNKVNDLLTDGKFLPMHKVDTIHSFKDFSSKNVPANEFKIVFSSDGCEGAWDIATMSMRGISSCQTWAHGGGGNSSHVVGSIVDPFTGILYLTSGAKHGTYGSKMIRRCIVRFVVNEKTKKQSIYIERMYPALDASVKNSFVEFIRRKTGGKFAVHYGPEMYGKTGASTTYVPMANIVKGLQASEHPYRDSGMVYKTDPNDKLGMTRELSDVVFNRINALLGSKVLSTARAIKMATVDEKSKDGFRKLRGSGYDNYSYMIYEDLVANAKAVFASVNTADCKNSEEIVQLGLTQFSNGLDQRIFDVLKTSVKKRRVGYVSDELLRLLALSSAKKVLTGVKLEENKLERSKRAAKAGKIDAIEDVPIYIKLLH